jgi:hypothetical protein
MLVVSSERLCHGSPSFFIRERKTFTTFYFADHYGEDSPNIWCPAPPGVREQMVEAEPRRFYRPPYVGHRGWIGGRLEVDPDWTEVAGIIDEGFRHVAPQMVLKQLDE